MIDEIHDPNFQSRRGGGGADEGGWADKGGWADEADGGDRSYRAGGAGGSVALMGVMGAARAWQATAAAATTLRESTPAAIARGAIGMHTHESASCIQREDRPSPSVPSSSATRSSGRLPGPSAVPIGVADWSGVSASSRNPAARSCARPSYQLPIRAYGMANTAPMDTFTERR